MFSSDVSIETNVVSVEVAPVQVSNGEALYSSGSDQSFHSLYSRFSQRGPAIVKACLSHLFEQQDAVRAGRHRMCQRRVGHITIGERAFCARLGDRRAFGEADCVAIRISAP